MAVTRTQIGAVQFGRYQLVERLGSGGMAVVFRGILEGAQGISRSFVIKRIRPELSHERAFIDMLITEARISALLSHPAIVQITEFGEVNGEYFLAMEHVDGHDLGRVIKRCAEINASIPVAVACYIISELAAALDYAHRLSDAAGRPLAIVHRDISPSNAMLTQLGAVKLLDFGIAKATSQVRDDQTLSGTLKGKLAYMSPEQSEGLALDGRSDLFSLGIMFHECLTMRRLFKGRDDFETMRLVREAKVTPPSHVRVEVPHDLDRVVGKMLAKLPQDRYANGEEVVADLAPILHRLHGDAAAVKRFLTEIAPIPHRAVPLVAGASDSSDELPGPGSTRTQHSAPPDTVRRTRWSTIAALTALGITGVGGAVVLWPKPPPPVVAPIVVVSPSPVAVVSPPPVAVAPPEPTVRLDIEGPRGARVWLEGAPVAPLPLHLTLPARSQSRTLIIRASGLRDETRVIAGDRDASIKAHLRPRPRGEKDPLKDPFAP